ncbi:MAG: primosomal protein N' [Dictyoglomus sp. NZ13-RE01]|nr:MAG: primosomal protein N' [Dictyoglomus sp. NZ13-RE01]
MLIAKVILFDTRIPEKDFLYYYIPEELVDSAQVGKAVIIPLKKRRVLGYIWDISEEEVQGLELKPITAVLEKFPILSSSLISLVNWISEYYENSLFKSANYIFPSGINLKLKRIFKRVEPCSTKLTKKQEEVYEILKEEKNLEKLKKEVKVSESLLRDLIRKNVITERIEVELSEKIPRKEFFYIPKRDNWDIDKDSLLEFSKLKQSLSNKPLLLFVENRKERWRIYIEVIKYFFNKEKQVLIIFPTLNSLFDFLQFLEDKVPIKYYPYHGLLTPAQSYQVYKLSYEEKPILIVSSGKGIFLPFSSLGVIILDEEENEFYNMREKEPRFDVSKVAVKRAELDKIPIILGTSSPSVASFYNSIKGVYSLYRKSAKKPKISVIDMRRGKGEVLSYYTLKRVKEVLYNNKQVFFLLNRLGYSTYLQCNDCGYTFYCPHCSTSLVYHSDTLELKCHYCGYSMPAVTTCPKCGGYSFNYGGLGTEKLESYLKRLFPKKIVQRWDSEKDIKDETILYKSDIIVGTRLIVPWIPRMSVGLLIVVNLDNFLHLPDFSMPEKIFHLIRRIMSDFPGEELIIQTYSSQHYVIRALKANFYNLFLHEELNLRKTLSYPPFSTLHQILLIGDDENELIEEGIKLRDMIKEKYENLSILGPAPFFPMVLREKYRYQLIIKDESDLPLNLKNIVEYNNTFASYKVIINKDVREIL